MCEQHVITTVQKAMALLVVSIPHSLPPTIEVWWWSVARTAQELEQRWRKSVYLRDLHSSTAPRPERSKGVHVWLSQESPAVDHFEAPA